MPDAHSIENYRIPKGIIKFDRWDDDNLPTGLRDVGNCTEFNITVEVEKLQHQTQRSGIREIDLTKVISRILKVSFILDEWDKKNLSMALFGTLSGQIITIFDKTEVRGQLQIIGTNDIGPRFTANLWDVILSPTGPLPMIGDDWALIPFDVEVQKDLANHPLSPYGTIQEIFES